MRESDSQLEGISFHQNVRFSKHDMPALPEGFIPHVGDFKEGCVGQYRRGQFHAYDMKDYWLIHKDRFNPDTHPIEHIMFDTDLSFLSALRRLKFSLVRFAWEID